MTDLTTIGEVLIDLTQTGTNQQGVPLFAANPGGAPANVAVAAARLGARTAFLGKIGRDGFGDYLKSVLQENQVDVAGLRTDDNATTRSARRNTHLLMWLISLQIILPSRRVFVTVATSG